MFLRTEISDFFGEPCSRHVAVVYMNPFKLDPRSVAIIYSGAMIRVEDRKQHKESTEAQVPNP